VKAAWGFLALSAVVAMIALWAPLAHAGSYDVLSCSIDGGLYPNNAWTAANNPAGDARYATDASCLKLNDPLRVALAAGSYFLPGTYARLLFMAPPGTAITNYKVVEHHFWYAPGNGGPWETTYEAMTFGPTFFSGAGQFDRATQDTLVPEGHWYGWVGDVLNGPVDAVDTSAITRTLSDSPVAMRQGTAPFMSLSAGCWSGAPTCTLSSAAGVFLELYGSRVTITDTTTPALTGPAAGAGLLAPGVRSGDEPLTFSATDNVGIRRAEIVDVTDAAKPSVVASADYNATPTVQSAKCSYSRPRPCPDLTKQTIAASPAIAGNRTLLLRVTDAAGNQTSSAPFAITARGAANGSGGGDGTRVVAGFPGYVIRGHGTGRHRVGILRPSKTVAWGHGARVRGIVRNAAGQPVAGAQLRLLVRELRLGAGDVDRGAVTTGADGRFTFRITRGSSRRFRIAYRAYAGDDHLTAKSDVTFNTKARITVQAPGHVPSHGTARFRGSLRGGPLPPHGVTLELQARQPGRGWGTVRTTRTGSGGVYATRYRFNSAHGRFTFRMRLRSTDSYPYAGSTSAPVTVRVG
jgi:hypothetical protein